MTQKNVIFSYFLKLFEYWGNFQSSYETKKIFFMEKIMRLILDEVIMSDGHMSDGQMHSCLQFFPEHWKSYAKLKIGLHCNRLLAAHIHCDTTLIKMILLKCMSIRHTMRKKNHAAWLNIVFSFDVKFLFLTENTEE